MTVGIAIGALTLVAARPPQVPVFASATELVYVVVSVSLASGEPIPELGRTDFVIREDGRERPITVFSRARDLEEAGRNAFPVDVTLLLDTSGSMRPGLNTSRALALQFIQSIPKATTRRLVTFNNEVRVWAFNDAKPEASLDAALALAPNAGSRLFDGIMATLELPARRDERRVIVSLTDGMDEGSQVDRAIAEKALQDGGVTFYAVSFAAQLQSPTPLFDYSRKDPIPRRSDADRAALNLQSLTSKSGGFVVQGTVPDLAAQFDRVRADISAQYVIGFEPAPSKPGKRHRLSVEVRQPDVRIRHRGSYETRVPPMP